MPLTVKRLGATKDQPFAIEVQSSWPDATSLLAHLEKLPTLRVISKREWRLTDDVWAEFEYRGFPFLIESPFARLWIAAVAPDVPEAVFREIETHVTQYRGVGLVARWNAAWRYLRLRGKR